MSRAQLLVLRTADTEGFWWEMKHAAENMAPEQLMFLLPFKKDNYRRFCERADTLLPCRLPEYQGGANLVGSRLRAMLYFDRDWTPHLQKLKVPFSLSLTPLVLGLKKALQPVVERLPAEARQTPVRHRRLAFLRTIPAVMLVVVGILMLGAFANGIRSAFSAATHNARGLTLYKEHDLDDAIAEFQQAIRIDPTLVVAHENLCEARSQQNNLDDIVAECSEARRLNPSSANAHYLLGNVACLRSDFASAIGHYRDALRLSPGLVLAHNNLGLTLAKTGKLEEAMTEYRDAIQLNPDSPEAHVNLGEALAARGDWAGAVIEFRTAVRLLPNAGLVHYDLGFALDRQGEYAAAREEFIKAYELAPDNPEIRRTYQQIMRR